MSVGTDYSVYYTHSETSTLVEATVADDTGAGDGVLLVTTTLTEAGPYQLTILLRGLNVPT